MGILEDPLECRITPRNSANNTKSISWVTWTPSQEPKLSKTKIFIWLIWRFMGSKRYGRNLFICMPSSGYFYKSFRLCICWAGNTEICDLSSSKILQVFLIYLRSGSPLCSVSIRSILTFITMVTQSSI